MGAVPGQRQGEGSLADRFGSPEAGGSSPTPSTRLQEGYAGDTPPWPSGLSEAGAWASVPPLRQSGIGNVSFFLIIIL